MWYKILSHPLVKITVVLLLLVGCSSPSLTPALMTEVPPIQTSTVLRISADMLIGNWQPLSNSHDATFLQINSDSTCRQSYSLEELTNAPQVECTYIFDGTVLSLTAVKLNGVPECPSPTGRYEVQLVTDNQIQLRSKIDSCRPRVRSTAGMYQRIP